VLILDLLVDLQQKVGELVLSTTSCVSIIILGNLLNYLREKCGYGNFNHQYNVSPIHMHALLYVQKFTAVVPLCANRLCSGPRLPEV
jgi:hypothetical protein